MDDWQFYEKMQDIENLLIDIRDRLPVLAITSGVCGMCGTQWTGRDRCPQCYANDRGTERGT